MSAKRRAKRHQRSERHRGRAVLILLLVVILLLLLILLFLPDLFPDGFLSSGGTAASSDSLPDSSVSVTDPPAVSESSSPLSSPSAAVPSEEPLPSVSEAPWYLTLVNRDHALPSDWTVETADLSNGLEVDCRIYDALTCMLEDCEAAGLSPLVCSAYRTIPKQSELLDNKISSLTQDGMSYEEAYEEASSVIAIPGTSEHNLGLSVDICASSYQLLDDAQADTAEQIWLMEHCAEYGFILRYPLGKQEITGIIWEPWHYRYVGVEAAQEITESGLCLEEYLALSYSLDS